MIKKLNALVCVLGLGIILGGCSGSGQQTSDEGITYVQTHQDDNVTRVFARITAKGEGKERMGRIRFTEKDSGLQMRVRLKDVKPNTEYKLCVYEMTNCDMKAIKKGDKSAKQSCEKEKMDLNLPRLQSDKDGNIQSSFMINGLAATQLANTKITVVRETSGEKTVVGWGMLKQKGMF